MVRFYPCNSFFLTCCSPERFSLGHVSHAMATEYINGYCFNPPWFPRVIYIHNVSESLLLPRCFLKVVLLPQWFLWTVLPPQCLAINTQIPWWFLGTFLGVPGTIFKGRIIPARDLKGVLDIFQTCSPRFVLLPQSFLRATPAKISKDRFSTIIAKGFHLRG